MALNVQKYLFTPKTFVNDATINAAAGPTNFTKAAVSLVINCSAAIRSVVEPVNELNLVLKSSILWITGIFCY